MNVKISLLCLSFCFTAAISMSIPENLGWDAYKRKFNKTYNDPDEELAHEKNYYRNVEKITRHNVRYDNKEVSYKLGINQFADLNETGIAELKGLAEFFEDFETKPLEHESKYDVYVPDFFNWTQHGISSEIKDKGKCKSDWAFAAAGMLEGYSYKTTKPFKPLSVQDLIECSETMGNHGCDESYVNEALEYVKLHGIATELSYPFKPEVEECKKNITRDGIHNYKKIKYTKASRDEGMLKYTVYNKGPIAAKIFASPDFFFYKGGIFTGEDCESNIVDYNVLIVGYDIVQETRQEYWIVKNWWGKSWGEQGYARISRNNNTCGIASQIWS